MSKAGRIISVNPPNAIPGGEVSIECEDFQINSYDDYGCFFDGQAARVVAASASRILTIVPETFDTTDVEIYLESGGDRSEPFNIKVGKKIAEDLHIVANPAVDPKDDSIILTRSGSRGQKLPVTLYRLEADGFLNDIPADVLNPTGIAFDSSGDLFVTNRADGEVSRITSDGEVIPFASELGIATGLAFDREGAMYVGDRSGTIYRSEGFGRAESFAILEPSVSAYHMAFGLDGRLYVTAPKLSGFDAIYAIDRDGYEHIFYRGFGRPQGLAFDRDGNCYAAACFEGRHGIAKVTPDGERAEMFVAGMNVVGLCFTRKGDMIVATNEDVYSLPLGIYGTLLD
jgi:sugar lactone lactonase YvrE